MTFSFTSNGADTFHKATATIAHRAALLSRPGQALNEYVAIALDNKLLTVPQIDFKTYPAGVRADNGSDISSDFTIQSAQRSSRTAAVWRAALGTPSHLT